MVYQSLSSERCSGPGQVWSGLKDDVRQQAVQLLAQLAVNLALSQARQSGMQEQDHGKARFLKG
jgi:hypothetical protein